MVEAVDIVTISWDTFLSKYYKEQVEEAVLSGSKSLRIDYQDIDEFNPQAAEELINRPERALAGLGDALAEIAGKPIHPRVHNPPNLIPIRSIRAEHLGKLIAIEGLVKKATEVRPKITQGAFQCALCGAVVMVPQNDVAFKEPAFCPECQRRGPFRLLRNDSRYIDVQKIEVQESPEGLRGGEQPQSITVFLEDDLAGLGLPGDRTMVDGVLQSIQRRYGTAKSREFNIYIDANEFVTEEHEFEELEVAPEEIETIRSLSQDKSIYQKMISSIAPTIYGMAEEKEALALQLFGGLSKPMPDGTKIRGDIHMLTVGDPGTAKSQLLRYIGNIAPRGIYTAGMGSSAAGLTATAVKDEFGEGRWTLEAGALVLGDGGIVCVDEIDKMRNEDRSAMHEAMEQQTVSVAKAGITATLQARCALLAAANPKYGRFDPYVPIAEQINLAPTLLSRFDLIFLIKDIPERETDTLMADHILSEHYLGEMEKYQGMDVEGKYTEELESVQKALRPAIEPDLLRKYIAYARRTVFPVMGKEARETLRDYYVNLRSRAEGGNAPIPITPRQLEAFVRLSEASARVRLSNEITREDAERAIGIVEYCMRGIAVDTETGLWDMDLIMTGTSFTQRDRINKIKSIIRDLTPEHPDGALHEDIMKRAAETNIPKEKVDDILRKLVQVGDLYQPRSERYKLSMEY